MFMSTHGPLAASAYVVALALLLSVCSPTQSFTAQADAPAIEAPRQEDLFIGTGEPGKPGKYHTYRIPAIVLTKSGTLLAFCEGRKDNARDDGDIDLLLRRGLEGGKSWEKAQLVVEEGGTAPITIGNPCPVVDRQTGTVWLLYCLNNDRVFVTRSEDDGKTWAAGVEITQDVKKPEWDWVATGPGHGIQLASGRLLIPCDHRERDRQDWGKGGASHIVYSDDHGKTWKLGESTAFGMNECQAVETADGGVLLSMRNYLATKQRAFSLSKDGGLTWSPPRLNEQVFCPVCQASIVRHSLAPENRILHSGPGGPGRTAMTVRVSYDEGKGWPFAAVLYAGPTAYSDLVVFPDGSIGCLFERGQRRAYERITFARFSLAWVTGGKDR
jgi:sialidase-1